MQKQIPGVWSFHSGSERSRKPGRVGGSFVLLGTRQDNDVELLTGHTVARTRHFPTKLEEQVGQERLSLSWQISAAAAELLRFTEEEVEEEEEEEEEEGAERTVS